MSFEPAEVFWIEDAETFDVLGDPTRIELLELTARPRSVAEIAEAMGVPRTRLYHHVNLMEEKGLIAVAETRQKGAMTEKRYQSAAKSYRPSDSFLNDATPRERAESVMTSIFGATRADFLRAIEEERFGFTDAKDERKVAIGRALLRLTPERLSELIVELEEVLAQYMEDDDPSAMPVAVTHLIHPSSREMP
ncbi:MAG: helix-turn-helix domain-containing protein [Acidimicrobiia bacterium]|nr:helix-turn-helix domain-containing protein [Acidimicrobiia bacterium]